MSELTPYEKYNQSQYKHDTEVLRKRLGLDFDSFWKEDDTSVVRFDYADEPWLEYDADGNRLHFAYDDDTTWKRDEGFWAVIDKAAVTRDEDLAKLWEDACFELSWNRDQWKGRMLGLEDSDEQRKQEYRPVWDKNRSFMGSSPGSSWRKYNFEETD